MMKKKKNLNILIIGIMILSLCGTGFFLRREKDSRSGDFAYAATEELAEGREVRQYFTTQERYLFFVSFALMFDRNMEREGHILFSLYNDKEELLFQEKIDYAEMAYSTYYKVEIKRWIKKGARYYYTLTAEDVGENLPKVVYNADPSMYVPENTLLLVDMEEVEGQALNWYVWGERLHLNNIIFIWAWILIVGLLALEKNTSLFGKFMV